MLRSLIIPLLALTTLVLGDSIAELPPCTSKCAVQTAKADGCDPADLNCVCADGAFGDKSRDCSFTAGCNLADISETSFRLQAMCANPPPPTDTTTTTTSKTTTTTSGASKPAQTSQTTKQSSSQATQSAPSNTGTTNSFSIQPVNTLLSTPTVDPNQSNVVQTISQTFTAGTSPTDGAGGDAFPPGQGSARSIKGGFSYGVVAGVAVGLMSYVVL